MSCQLRKIHESFMESPISRFFFLLEEFCNPLEITINFPILFTTDVVDSPGIGHSVNTPINPL